VRRAAALLALALPLALPLALGGAARHASASEAEAWAALRAGGAVALVRHARAPGVGDPPGFRLDECATQRNLSEEGREQARRLGEALRGRGVEVARALSSRWCRALDTARLAFGAAEPFPPLDSFFGDRGDEPDATAATRREIQSWRGPGVLAMVTHQVNVTALTGVYPREGEVVVLVPGEDGHRVVGRVDPTAP
jgi:broad specificity phosphatase PhoE